MPEELRKLAEAILFAAGRKLELAEIAKLCRHSEADVLSVLTEWKANLESSNGPTMLVQDGTGWKLTVREQYIPVIKRVVTKTELPKSILETLAVVAYKAPVLQSKVIKIRTNKAYDHLRSLEESGMLTREKHGRSKLIKLTPRFYEYFDIDPRKLREKFQNKAELEKAIEAKEAEIESLEAEQQKQTEERLEKPKIDFHQNVETYDAIEIVEKLEPTSGVEVIEDKVGDLPVYDIPPENMTPEEKAEWDAAHKPHKKKHHKKKHKPAHPAATSEHDATEPIPEAPPNAEVEHSEPAVTPETPKTQSEKSSFESPAQKTEPPAAPAKEAEPETEPTTEKPAQHIPTETPVPAPQAVPPSPSVQEKNIEPEHEEKKSAPPPKKKRERKHKEHEPTPEQPEAQKEAAEEAQKEKDILSPQAIPERELSPAEKVHKEAQEKAARLKPRDFEKGDGIKTTPEMETEIEKRVKRILGGEEELPEEPTSDDETAPPM
ncbi:hypothetical protein C4580_03455 [Candidatus Woesearchaeota archaeon]|nr:MAG: hypothetical protein C4580_03455 [Candidatus Woesearchaeota archaeon]